MHGYPVDESDSDSYYGDYDHYYDENDWDYHVGDADWEVSREAHDLEALRVKMAEKKLLKVKWRRLCNLLNSCLTDLKPKIMFQKHFCTFANCMFK